MKELIFTTAINEEILRIVFDFKNNSVSVCEVDKEREEIANLYLERYKALTYESLEEKLCFYLDTNYKLPMIIKHIEENGFYSPYVPNLRITVKDCYER